MKRSPLWGNTDTILSGGRFRHQACVFFYLRVAFILLVVHIHVNPFAGYIRLG